MATWKHERYLKMEKVRAWLRCFPAGTADCRESEIGDDGMVVYEFMAPREWTPRERIWMGSRDMTKGIMVAEVGRVITAQG